MRIGFIGSGRMGFALMKALKENGYNDIIANDIHKEALDFVSKELNLETTLSAEEVVSSDIVFIAVKPHHIADLKFNDSKDQIIISIAAGVTIAKLCELFPNKKIVRVMPNMPAMVGELAAGFSCADNVSKEDSDLVEKMLKSIGTAYKVSENLIPAVIAVSGSGPGFLAYYAKHIIDAVVKEGLDKSVALDLMSKTLIGTGKVLKKMDPEELMTAVASPGGVTQAGFDSLDKNNVDKAFAKMVVDAIKKDNELSEKN